MNTWIVAGLVGLLTGLVIGALIFNQPIHPVATAFAILAICVGWAITGAMLVREEKQG